MDIREYEKFCSEAENGNFMQSSYWTKVKSNWIPEYIIVRDENHCIVGTMLVLIKKVPFLNMSFMYAPRGPVCDMHNMKILSAVFSQVKTLAKEHHAFMLKIDPLIDENDGQSISNLRSMGFDYHKEKVGYDNTQCRENYILDIEGKREEEVFSSFKPKCRYNIRLAERKGVTCGFYGEDKLDDFCSLMKETSQRDGFDMRSKEYFTRILKSFDGKAKLCMCYKNGTPLSGAICVNYAGTVSYVYGCSSNDYRNFMPNYLMQWTMIKYAVRTGCKKYDFCGVPYWYDKTHRNYGVYRFKQNFNGYVKTWAGEFDYVFRENTYRCVNLLLSLKNKMI